MKTDALDYDLPERLIATKPAEPRDQARLLVIRRQTGQIEHHRVADLPTLGILGPSDLMVVNQTRVLPALLVGTRDATGGSVKGLYLDSEGPTTWRLMLESRGTLQVGETVSLIKDGQEPAQLKLIASQGGGEWSAELINGGATEQVLQRLGATPLPPYIRKQRKAAGLDEVDQRDEQRYNTIYAQAAGSVAAPTAGLHFTEPLLSAIEALGVKRVAVDLHVGMGTFAPVRSDTLQDHAMHHESYTVPRATLDAIAHTRQNGGRLLVIGTTTVRALESLPDDALTPSAYPEGCTGLTDLFIHPEAGFTFRFTDRLMTNFHLPKSTLLALVASLPGVGLSRLMDAYEQAVTNDYRFYSYGDAMLVV